MFRKMPHILCAFMHPNDQLLQPIYAFGQRHGWLIELCRDVIPRDWQGDGVISDYLTLEDLLGPSAISGKFRLYRESCRRAAMCDPY